jgi:hypothetical protein
MASRRTVLYQGKQVSAKELAQLTGLPYSLVSCRMANYWTADDIINTPQRTRKARELTLEWEGKTLNTYDVAALTGLPRTTVSSRMSQGWTAYEVINTPYGQRGVRPHE